ncbi:2-phospho-L-lactate transferase, partial [Acidocella aquatica]|uniref:2-phospho-L-lactate transferase n=1 Tax=Acidocella aquatica TaxID=1922313 RepID=UPI0024E09547
MTLLPATPRTAVLTGGVGGAKLVLGLAQILPPENLTAIVNTGDDFTHLGLAISPDIDTLLYTLSGKANAAQGWGREGESWSFLAALRTLGGPDWFQLGDGDLALHVLRTAALASGQPLSQIIANFAQAWNIGPAVLPMTDGRVATMLTTDEGELDFQHYFVARRCAPKVSAIRFAGAAQAAPAPGVLAAIAQAEAILIAPSNPYLSIGPILAIPGIAAALKAAKAPIIAISPIVGGQAVKGPTAKLMAELGIAITNTAIAAHYAGIIDGLLLDQRDPPKGPGIPHAAADTLMHTLEDRIRVARAALALAGTIS